MNNMRWKTIRVLVLLVSLGTTILAGDEAFFGETPLRALCDRSDAIVTGAISWGDITITHGGMARTPLTVRVTEVLKGAVTNSEVGVLVVTCMGTFPRRDLTNGCRCVVFLTRRLETVDPWFSVQPEDRSLIWAVKALVENETRGRSTTAPTLPATSAEVQRRRR